MSNGYGVVSMGTDPEFFFLNESGEVYPADKLLPSVNEPKTLVEDVWNTSGGPTVTGHYDGLQGEFTVKESFCRQFLAQRIRKGLKIVNEMASAQKLTVNLDACRDITPEILESATPEARNFGCDLDFISWLDGMPNPLRVDPLDHFVRYSGGHIHLGILDVSGYPQTYKTYFKDTESLERVSDILMGDKSSIKVIKALDYIVGNTSVLLDQTPQAAKRRKVYGKAGVYRRPPHGIEYRVLSNFWLKHPSITNLIFALARDVIGAFLKDEAIIDNLLDSVAPEDVIVAINTNDKELAFRNWLKITNAFKFTERDITEGGIVTIAYLSKFGLNSVISENFAENWRFDDVFESYSNIIPSFNELTRKLIDNNQSYRDFNSSFKNTEIYV